MKVIQKKCRHKVLAGDKAGSKFTKANELGVKVIDESTFNKMSEEWK